MLLNYCSSIDFNYDTESHDINTKADINEIIEYIRSMKLLNKTLEKALVSYVLFRYMLYVNNIFNEPIKTKKLILNLLLNLEENYYSEENLIHCIRYSISKRKEVISPNYSVYEQCGECSFECVDNMKKTYNSNTRSTLEKLYENVECEYFEAY